MNIYINEQKIETTLGTEKNLAEVFDGISQWLESQGHVVTGFLLDGKEKEPEELTTLAIEENRRLDFFSGKKQDIILEGLAEMDAYLDRVGNTMVNRDSLTEKESRDILEGSQWVCQVLNSIGTILKLDYNNIFPSEPSRSIADNLKNIDELSQNMESSKNMEAFLSNLRDIKLFIMDLNHQLSAYSLDSATVREIIQLFSEKMNVLKDEFSQVNENFQSGKDGVASELLSHSIDRLSSLVTALLAIQNQPEQYGIEKEWFSRDEYKTKADALNEMLKEAMQCLESGDIVQAGDIFEYELPELLDGIVPFLKDLYVRMAE